MLRAIGSSLRIKKTVLHGPILTPLASFSSNPYPNFIKNFPSNSLENSFMSNFINLDKDKKLKIHPSVELENLSGALGYNLKASDANIKKGDVLLSVPPSIWQLYSSEYCYNFIKTKHASWFSFLSSVVSEIVPQESQAGQKRLIEISCMCVCMMNDWYSQGKGLESRNSYLDLLRFNSFPSNMKSLPHPLLMSPSFFIDPYLRSTKVYSDLSKRQQLYEKLANRLFPSLEDSTYKPADDFLGSSSLLIDSFSQAKNNKASTYIKPPLPSFATILETKSSYFSELEQIQEAQLKAEGKEVKKKEKEEPEVYPSITPKRLPLSSDILCTDFLWALSQILSRGLSQVSENVPLTLVPFLDFANHGDNSLLFHKAGEDTSDLSTLEPIVNAQHSYNAASSAFELLALRDIKSGESINISYGEMRNSSSFLNIYGFHGNYFNLNNKLSITLNNEMTFPEDDPEFQPSLVLDASGEEIRAKVKKPLESEEFHFNFLDDNNKIGLLTSLVHDLIDNKLISNISKKDISISKTQIQINLDLFSLLLDSDSDENSPEYYEKVKTMKSFTYLCKLIHSIDYLHALEKYNRSNPSGFVPFNPDKAFSPALELSDYIRALFYIQKIIRFNYFTPEKFVSFEFQLKDDSPDKLMPMDEEAEKKLKEEEKKKKFLNAKKYNKDNIELILNQMEKDEEIEQKFLAHLKDITDLLLPEDVQTNKKNPLQGFNPTHAFWIASCARFIELESKALVQLRSLIKHAIQNTK